MGRYLFFDSLQQMMSCFSSFSAALVVTKVRSFSLAARILVSELNACLIFSTVALPTDDLMAVAKISLSLATDLRSR